jgi:hypothetical protein
MNERCDEPPQQTDPRQYKRYPQKCESDRLPIPTLIHSPQTPRQIHMHTQKTKAETIVTTKPEEK